MKFVVVFKYMDGETFEIEVHPDDMEAFMSAVGSSEVYYNESKGVGVWVPVDKIRYFQVEKVDEKGRRIVVGNPGLPKLDGTDLIGAPRASD